MRFSVLICFAGLLFAACHPATKLAQTTPASMVNDSPNALTNILLQAGLQPFLAQASQLKLQLIYTQINRKKGGEPSFTTYSFREGAEYYYPASTVKLPAAVLALEWINAHNEFGLTRETTMLTDGLRSGEPPVLTDGSSANGMPSVGHYIKKILLVSDNDAYNRLYELIGQEAFNQRLHQLGFTQAQIIHRLEISLTEAENRQTNAIRFVDKQGQLLYHQAAQTSRLTYAQRTDGLGKGYMRQGKLVETPMDFSQKNRWPLEHHHRLVQWILFPESQPASQKLNLTSEDYAFLQRYMHMLPHESDFPKYDPAEYWPSYVKFLMYGSEKEARIPPTMHIFNKVGDAYGFLIDGAYIHDKQTGVEFLMSAAMYCNSDGILNDNRYDYDSVGFPLMKRLGQAVYAAEKARRKL